MKNLFINLLVSAVSMVITFLVLESVARVYKSEYQRKNFLEEKWDLFRSAYPVQYDPILGWIPKEHVSGNKNVWGTQVTILEHGIRSNGSTNTGNVVPDLLPILVVGDSFAFGDEVSDHETWPAILEARLGKRVVNGGVFGYGIDQSFLRAKELSEIYKPGVLIFSFIADDIQRCELSERTGVEKPYYVISNSALSLRNVPVPPPRERTSISGIRRILGHSFLIHKIMMRTLRGFWLQGRWSMTRRHDDGENIACLLLQKLKDIAEENRIQRVVIVVQYLKGTDPTDDARLNRLLNCVDRRFLEVVDLKQVLIRQKEYDEGTYERLFKGLHMSYRGNYLVAHTLSQALGRPEKPERANEESELTEKGVTKGETGPGRLAQ